MVLKRLTTKQREILDKVMKKPCSMEELGKYFGISRQAIHERVILMRKKGYLKLTGKVTPTKEGISSIIERLSL